jgi:hypothetical protein
VTEAKMKQPDIEELPGYEEMFAGATVRAASRRGRGKSSS